MYVLSRHLFILLHFIQKLSCETPCLRLWSSKVLYISLVYYKIETSEDIFR